MNLPKYEIGQRVFVVSVNWSEKKVVCPDCLGGKEWTISLPSGEVFQHPCRTCMRGYFCEGVVSEWGDHARIEELTIGSIQINTADETPVKYMCNETGVGSGRVYNEQGMTKTRFDAEALAAKELERVAGLRQAEELKQRKYRKEDSLIHGKRKNKHK